MTKRRAIYGSAATSISLARCCPDAQLLFDRLISQADDQGRLQGDPLLVKSQCVPLVDKATTKAVDRWLGELESNGMILRYEAAGQPLVQIVKWWEHQDWMRHLYASRWPAPGGWDQDRTKGNGAREDADNRPPDGGNVPSDGGSLPAKGRIVPATGGPSASGGGVSGESGDVSEIEASRGGDAPEATPPTELSSHSLSRVLTTHFDLTGVKASPGGEQMYRDLIRVYGYEVVNRAQWNVGASDKSDRGFIGRVKTQCKRLAA